MAWVEALFVWSVAKGAGADLLGAMLRQIYPLFLSFADIVGKAVLKGEEPVWHLRFRQDG